MKNNLDIKELATELGCSEMTIRNMIKRKSIPYIMVGKNYRFIFDDVIAYFKSCGNGYSESNG